MGICPSERSNVADAYKRLRRLQDQYIEFKLKNTRLSPAQERRYKKLKDDIITEVKSLRLNQTRIDSLVEQLYDINKRLVGYEGRLMRLPESHGVAREDFLKTYQGSELAPRWLNRVSKLSAHRQADRRGDGRDRGGESRPERRPAQRTIIARRSTGDARRPDRPRLRYRNGRARRQGEGHPWPRLRIFPFTLCANGTVE